MTKARKVHWAYLETRGPNAVRPACGEPARRAHVTHDQSLVTCGRCLRLLGLDTKEGRIAGAVRKAAKAQGVDMWTNDGGADSLIRRAFSDLDATFDTLVSKARESLSDYERRKPHYPPDSIVDGMADVLRGFISALGRAD